MAEVLEVGPDSEREFILFELQQLLDHCLEDTMKILIPVLCKHVPKWNIDLQIKAAQRLYDVVCLELDHETANMITCASFGVIQRSKGCAAPEYEELYNLWGGLLVDCLPNMPWSPLEIDDVIRLVDNHSNESYTSRKVAARVIGALAQCLDKAKVEKIILPRALSLLDDTDVEVRGTVVESLAMVGAALPIRITEIDVWPRIEALLDSSEEARVRATAMRTMAHILDSHRPSQGQSRLFRELLPPVFARLALFAKKSSGEDQRLVDDDTYLLLEVVSEVFGQFAYSLSLSSKKTFRKEAYKAYAGMATCNGPLIRRNCAFNLPGIAKALGDRFALELSGLCDYLANDMDEQVRWILAAGIHETAALLASRGNFERLFGAVCALLQDESPMVRMNALTHFHDLLTAFAKDGNDPASLRRLAPVFDDLTRLSEGEWRIQKSLAEQLGKCADIIPPEALIDNVLPLLYRLTRQGTPLVREAAMDATARSLRNIPVVRDRNMAIEKYWKAAAQGPFWMRLALLDGGTAAMKVFSHKRFAELFATEMLRLSCDPVPNVRIRVAAVLARMAPMCMTSPPYKMALDTLRHDKDSDVASLMTKYDEAVRVALKEAKEQVIEDQTKYREEQEFYGLNKTQKRVRGRLAATKGNRIIMQVRRPSLEQSSGQLAVSKAVISAAKASSAAASLKGGYHLPHIPEADSAVSLGPSMEDMTADGLPDTVEVEGEGVVNQNDCLMSGIESDMPGDFVSHLAAPGQIGLMEHPNRGAGGHTGLLPVLGPPHSSGGRPKERRGMEPSINGNVPIVQKTMGNASRYEARSKSWNGIIAQFPRQLSMESRNRKNAAKNSTDEGSNSGWTRQNKDGGPKRKLSSLRRKKKRNSAVDESSISEISGTTEASDMAPEVVDYPSVAPRPVAARAKSMVHPAPSPDGVVRPTMTLTDYSGLTDYSALPDYSGLPHYSALPDYSGLAPTDMSTKKRGMLGKVRSKMSYDSADHYQGVGAGHLMPVTFAKDSGLPAFKGHAPWLRQKHADEDLHGLSEAVHRATVGSGDVGESNGVDLDTSRMGGPTSLGAAKKAYMVKPNHGGNMLDPPSSSSSDFHIVPGGPDAGSTNVSFDGGSNAAGSSAGGGNGGFLRGLFRRRR